MTPSSGEGVASTLTRLVATTLDQRVPALERIAAARACQDALAELLRGAVADARASGGSWAQIGRALRVPRQTAHRRYSA